MVSVKRLTRILRTNFLTESHFLHHTNLHYDGAIAKLADIPVPMDRCARLSLVKGLS